MANQNNRAPDGIVDSPHVLTRETQYVTHHKKTRLTLQFDICVFGISV
jgi:hypothetical protein